MKQIINKFLIIFIVIILINFIYITKTYAMGTMFKDAENFLKKGDTVESVINETNLQNTSTTIYKAFMAVAIVTALIVGAVIGIKFIYESAEGQAKVKEAFVAYVAGCLIVFSAFGIWKFVINFGNSQGLLYEKKIPKISVKCTTCGWEGEFVQGQEPSTCPKGHLLTQNQ